MATATQTKPVPAPSAPGEFLPAHFRAWRVCMGYSQREAASALGCSRVALAGWENDDGRPPLYIGLACAALALGMKPYQG
jgi:transcriptional regulator with XRE-family HTH domain